jgi:hypothetical protein
MPDREQDEEIAQLRAEADRMLAESKRMLEEAKRRRIAITAECDQTRAFAQEVIGRARALGYQGSAPVRGLSARSAWLTAEILDSLGAEAPLPVSTMHLVRSRGLLPEYATVLRLLNRLAQLGEVEKWPAGESRCCYWRRLGDGEA